MSNTIYIIICVALVSIIFGPFIYAAAKESQRQKIEREKQLRAAERAAKRKATRETIKRQREEIAKNRKPEEIEVFMKLDYMGLVNKLLEKYGPSNKDYFTYFGGTVFSKPKGLTRTDEGLFVHHIDENRYPGLSQDGIFSTEFKMLNGLTDYQVRLIRKDFQKADRLVYCNLIEHLLLHVKAFENQIPLVKGTEVASRGAKILADDVRKALTGRFGTMPWQTNVAEAISGQWDEYLEILRYAHNIARISGFARLITLAEKEKEKHENMILRRRSSSC